MSELNQAPTLEEIHEQVEQVLEADRHDGDPELAHLQQDAVYVAVLRAAAAGDPDAQRMAQDALRIEDEGAGQRWYA